MKKIILLVCVGLSLLMIYSCSKEEAAAPETSPVLTNTVTATVTTSTITYSNTINSIISSHCTISCHKSGTNGFAVANLTNYTGLKTEVNAGTFRNRVIVQKNMPPGGALLSSTIQKLQEWIDNGAPE